jgi:molybdate transport system substrate-binding protein
MRSWRALGGALAGILLGGLAHGGEPKRGGVTVFAAASLTESVQELAEIYRKQTGVVVRSSFASSGMLARQIDAGAQADIFISADTASMDFLEQHHLLVMGTHHMLVTNRLIVYA